MFMLLWVLYFIPVLLISFVGYMFAPIFGMFITSSERADRVKQIDNGQHTLVRDYLVKCFYWFQTHDNAVDEYWYGAFNRDSVLAYFRNATQAQYDSSRIFRWACRVMWLWRNCAYGFQYHIFSRPLDELLSVYQRGDEDQGFWIELINRRSSFQLKANIPTPWFWYFSINIGWKTHTGFPLCMYAGRIIGTRSRS